MAALRQLFSDCLRKTADLLLLSGSIPLAVWKSTLIDDLALLEDTPFILALDDYHLVGNPSIDLLLADVLRSEIAVAASDHLRPAQSFPVVQPAEGSKADRGNSYGRSAFHRHRSGACTLTRPLIFR